MAAKLQAQKREIDGKQVKRLRNEGQIPAVAYGPKFESTNVVIDNSEFRKLFNTVGYSNMFNLSFNGKEEKAVIKEVQQHPTTDQFLHISIYVTDPESKISAEIPLEFEGVAPAEDQGLGFLVTPVSEVEVRCLPQDLPSTLTVDLTKLESPADAVTIEDITLPEGVELDSDVDPTTVVASVATAQKMEEIADEAEAAAAGETEEVTEVEGEGETASEDAEEQ